MQFWTRFSFGLWNERKSQRPAVEKIIFGLREPLVTIRGEPTNSCQVNTPHPPLAEVVKPWMVYQTRQEFAGYMG